MHELKHSGPAEVVAEVRRVAATQPESADSASHLAYLEKRTAHMQYPTFLAAGWPIGDGAVESGNKLVVEARLKGSGMHWARPHVDPLLALRNIVCSDRWDAAWPQIVRTLRQQAQQCRSERRHQRRTPRSSATDQPTAPVQNAAAPPPPAPAATAETLVWRQHPNRAHHPPRCNPANPGARRPITHGGTCPSAEHVSNRRSTPLMQNLEPHPEAK
ncbi:MAG: hypothetical protein NT169_22335 [Chloroflexi bacterium]|nr:hypothetical protein [Chloroflexota bacterium]